ncbi:MAG: T9SS type A sorting domain-containing protein, partial [bacterium]
VDLSGTTTTLTGAYVVSGSVRSILAAGDFHNITITGDTAIGGGYGVSVFGLDPPLSTNIVISNNVFYDFNDNGIYLRETDGAVISGNFFDKRTATVTSVNAIQIAQAANINSKIFNNVINVSQTSNGTQTFRGIYLFNGTGHKVYNNVISNINLTSGNFIGIIVRTPGTAPEIYFNTISIDNSSASAGDLTGIAEELSNTNSVIKNNIISISQSTTGLKAGISLGAVAVVTTAITSNYNLIYTPGGNVGIKDALTPTLYPTLSDWQNATTQDANSVFADAGLTLTTSIPTTSAADGTGTPIGFVTTDILGNPRGANPDMGAYEYIPVGVFDFNHSDNFRVYPNPARGEININLTQSNSASTLSIYNSTGQLELQKVIMPGVVNEKIQTDVFARGLHLVKIDSGQDSRIVKLILQ